MCNIAHPPITYVLLFVLVTHVWLTRKTPIRSARCAFHLAVSNGEESSRPWPTPSKSRHWPVSLCSTSMPSQDRTISTGWYRRRGLSTLRVAHTCNCTTLALVSRILLLNGIRVTGNVLETQAESRTDVINLSSESTLPLDVFCLSKVLIRHAMRSDGQHSMTRNTLWSNISQ